MEVELGSIAPLELQTFDGDVGVYPLAYVYDSTYTPVSGSPFSLTHVANGFYKNTAFTPPSSGKYKAIYKVFSDSGYTSLLLRHSIESEDINVSVSVSATVDAINTKIGTPTTGSISSDIQAVIDDVDSGEGRVV